MNRDWLTVFEALKGTYAEGAYSNMSVNEAVSRHKGCRESFVRAFAKGTLRDTIRLDHIIDCLAEKGVNSIKIRPLIIIRMGMYAVGALDSVPDHAAVNEAVSLAGSVARGSERFVNGILRSYIRRRDEFAPELLEPHIRYAFPEPLFSLLTEQYGEEAFRIAEALNSPQKLYLRTNTLKTTREGLIELLRDEGIEAQASDENPEAVSVSGSGIAGGRLFREGNFSIQSLSSMTAVRALRPSPGSRVLDLCAAPGGKTGYMAELMGNNGSITACDIHRHRLELIEAAMKRTGVVIAETVERDSTVFVPEYEESFDYVLADVPCSGLGVIAGKPEIKLSTDPEKYGDLISVQSRILGNAFSYVRKGGRLEYSTCTLNKNENESVVKDMLSKTGSSARIIEMETLLPYNGKVGFFYSIIEKTAN